MSQSPPLAAFCPPLAAAFALLRQRFPLLGEVQCEAGSKLTTWVACGPLLPPSQMPQALLLFVEAVLPLRSCKDGYRQVRFDLRTDAADPLGVPVWRASVRVDGTSVCLQSESWEGYMNGHEPPGGLLTHLANVCDNFVDDDDATAMAWVDPPVEKVAYLAYITHLGLISSHYLEGRGFELQRCCWCTANTATGRCETCRALIFCADCHRAFVEHMKTRGKPVHCPRCIYMDVYNQ